MNLEERINLLEKLSKELNPAEEPLLSKMERAKVKNPWFTLDNQIKSINNIRNNYLDKAKIKAWIANYELSDEPKNKVIGLILDDHKPLQGIHDLIAVFLSGNIAQIKIHENDKVLVDYFIDKMIEINPDCKDCIQVVDRMSAFDGIIATESENIAGYFTKYFGKYPNVLRNRRTSVAVLNGSETKEELELMANDVFDFFGLSSNNISKVFVPSGYDFITFLDNVDQFENIKHHVGYVNCYDYYRSILLMKLIEHKTNNSLTIVENADAKSHTSLVHYEFYSGEDDLQNKLSKQAEEIQRIYGTEIPKGYHSFGSARNNLLEEFENKKDVMQFLTTI